MRPCEGGGSGGSWVQFSVHFLVGLVFLLCFGSFTVFHRLSGRRRL